MIASRGGRVNGALQDPRAASETISVESRLTFSARRPVEEGEVNEQDWDVNTASTATSEG